MGDPTGDPILIVEEVVLLVVSGSVFDTSAVVTRSSNVSDMVREGGISISGIYSIVVIYRSSDC